ncbi:MAG: thiaminase/transcriptional activator TenA [Gammaproteobacteria bacterium]|jgi:thiaminase/transcriptional activator TenA
MNTFGSKVFAAWRASAGESWLAYTDHEFVRGLGDGTLPRSAFIAYLIQDYIFLMHFSRAWALAIVKSETPQQMRAAAVTVHALVNEEVQLHVRICAREGISEQDLVTADEAPENLAYTRYVINTGLSGDLLDLLTTLAPCVFGYAEIGFRLADCHDTPPLYREWIDSYHSDDYRPVCESVANLIGQVAYSKLGDNPEQNPRWPVLCQRFEMATRLEAGFWSMGLRLGGETSFA